MSRKLKVLVAWDMYGDFDSTRDYAEEFKDDAWAAERDVMRALEELGHEAVAVGVHHDLRLLQDELQRHKPDLVFNLVEIYDDNPSLDANVPAFLELLKVPYTGTGPLGLRLCKDKALAKQILSFHEIRNPKFQVCMRGRSAKRDPALAFPIMIKPVVEDASYGISLSSFVEDDAAFEERVRFLHESQGHDAIAEEYVDGRELYVGALGDGRLKVFPPRELHFGRMPEDGPRIATYKAKWDEAYRRRLGIRNSFAEELSEAAQKRVDAVCREAYRALRLNGYARFDIRLKDEEPWILEVNPNPHLARDEDFAQAAEKAGLSYPKLIQAILDQALP